MRLQNGVKLDVSDNLTNRSLVNLAFRKFSVGKISSSSSSSRRLVRVSSLPAKKRPSYSQSSRLILIHHQQLLLMNGKKVIHLVMIALVIIGLR